MTLKLADFFSLLPDSQGVIVYPGGGDNNIAGTKESLECCLKDDVLNANVTYIETTESKMDTIHIDIEEPEDNGL